MKTWGRLFKNYEQGDRALNQCGSVYIPRCEAGPVPTQGSSEPNICCSSTDAFLVLSGLSVRPPSPPVQLPPAVRASKVASCPHHPAIPVGGDSSGGPLVRRPALAKMARLMWRGGVRRGLTGAIPKPAGTLPALAPTHAVALLAPCPMSRPITSAGNRGVWLMGPSGRVSEGCWNRERPQTSWTRTDSLSAMGWQANRIIRARPTCLLLTFPPATW